MEAWSDGGLVSRNTPHGENLVWAIQVFFLEVFPEFPSLRNLLGRRDDRNVKTGIAE